MLLFSILMFSLEIPENATLTGLSVFEGTRIDTFELTYLTTVNSGRISGKTIIARCEGEFMRKTGVLYGMSGSPVYYNGELIGALSSTWSDSKEPIAGITPIDEMLEDVKYGLSGFVEADDDIKKYEVCLSGSGLASIAANILDNHLPVNFLLTDGSKQSFDTTEFTPGSVLSVVLAGGDATLAATGTVTFVKGDTVVGFGHPFLGEGACSYPMAGGFVNTVMPLTTLGFKLTTPTAVVGTITSDVNTGVSGIIGKIPETIPVKVDISSEGVLKSFDFWVCKSAVFTPVLIPVLSLSAFQSSALFTATGYCEIKTDIFLSNQEEVSFFNSYNGIGSVGEAWAGDIMLALNSVVSNTYERTYPDSIHVEITSFREPRVSIIKDLVLSRSRINEGENFTVTIILSQEGSGTSAVSVDVTTSGISAPDTLGIIACDAYNLSLFLFMENPLWSNYGSYEELLNVLKKIPSNNRIYLVLYERGANLTSGSRILGRTPLSVMSVMKYGDINTVPNFTSLRVLRTQEIDLNSVVSGAVVNRIVVEER